MTTPTHPDAARIAAELELPGKCSVPMWMNGCPAGFCGEPAYGYRPTCKEWRNAWTGEMIREDGKYNGFVPGLACPVHGGPTL